MADLTKSPFALFTVDGLPMCLKVTAVSVIDDYVRLSNGWSFRRSTGKPFGASASLGASVAKPADATVYAEINGASITEKQRVKDAKNAALKEARRLADEKKKEEKQARLKENADKFAEKKMRREQVAVANRERQRLRQTAFEADAAALHVGRTVLRQHQAARLSEAAAAPLTRHQKLAARLLEVLVVPDTADLVEQFIADYDAIRRARDLAASFVDAPDGPPGNDDQPPPDFDPLAHHKRYQT